MSSRAQTFAAVVLLTFSTFGSSAVLAQQTVRERAREPYLAGLAQMRSEAYDAAAKFFGTAIGIDPDFEMAHYMLGRVHLAQKHFPSAVQALVKSRDLYLAQGSRQFADKQAGQRLRRERLSELDDLISDLQRASPMTFQIREQIRQMEERKRQVEDLDRAKDLTPDKIVPAFVSLSLGSAYFRSGKLPEAEQAYAAAVAADPKTGEAHNNLAVVYLQTGRFAQAKAAVRAAEQAGVKVHPELKDEINAKGGKA